MSNVMSTALKGLVADIITKPSPAKIYPSPARPPRPKQYINGYEVQWTPQDGERKPIPIIKTARFYIQFPTKTDDIELPVGTSRVTYNKEKAQVEYFVRGSDEPIKRIHDQKHEPLPVPKYFSQLEYVEEIFDIDLYTGEIISTMRMDILPEAVHWKLRLQEFENNQVRAGVSKYSIDKKINKYMKSLTALRGVTVEELSQPVPKSVVDAIDYIHKQPAVRSF